MRSAFLDEEALEIRLLCDHREILVAGVVRDPGGSDKSLDSPWR